MANINSLTTSNSYSSSSSIYGNRNVLTGLASGMDTETMIQNSVTGYQQKITELQQEQTKLEWKQDAMREITTQINSITSKYTSFSSTTNLTSNAFFNNALSTATNGANASAVSATGKTGSDIKIKGVGQLATAARYSVEAAALDVNAATVAAGSAVDWEKKDTVGQVVGSITLKYGSQSVELKFDESDRDIDSAEKLKAAIEKKLDDAKLNTSSGAVKASSLIKVSYGSPNDNTFTFSANTEHALYDGNSVFINSVSGNAAKLLGASKPVSSQLTDQLKNNTFTVPTETGFSGLVKTPNMAEYLSGKKVDVTLDGSTQTITIGDLSSTAITVGDATMTLDQAVAALNDGEGDEEYQSQVRLAMKEAMNSALRTDLQASIDKKFGKGKLTVGESAAGGLQFNADDGSTVKVVSSEAWEALGIGKSGVSNYFNTANTLTQLLGGGDQAKNWLKENAALKAADGPRTQKDEEYYDANGDRVDQDGYRIDGEGNYIYGLQINGVNVGEFSADTAIESVLTAINSNADAGVNVSYSSLTGEFVFTARDTGSGGQISFDNALAKKLFTVSNAPEHKTLESVMGDSFQWDENGQAEIHLMSSTAQAPMSLGTFSKTDGLDKLMAAMNSAASGAYANRFTYDEGTETYAIRDRNGNELESDDRSFLFIDGTGYVTWGAVMDKANTTQPGGSSFTAGTNAKLTAVVNGKELELERSSNVINMDGLNVTLKETFTAEKDADMVTFTTSSDADKIVETVRSFVEDVNKLMSSVHEAYTTQPLKKSSSKSEGYQPLTEEDKASMSESAVKAYEEKAKTGLLFGDTDLSQLYQKLLNNVQSYGTDRADMESIGLSTTYSSGVTQISLDETKLRSALETNPDKVRTVFTKTTEGGSATNGLMANLKSTLNTYGSTSIATPGILVRKAGTKLSSLSLMNNNMQTQINNLTKRIESWQTKLSDKIDYYTKQFTQLEKLMSTMNNQSSMLSDLMGY